MRWLGVVLFLVVGCSDKPTICPESCGAGEIVCEGECIPMSRRCEAGPACRECDLVCDGIYAVACVTGCATLMGTEEEKDEIREYCSKYETNVCNAQDLEE